MNLNLPSVAIALGGCVAIFQGYPVVAVFAFILAVFAIE